MLHFKCVGIIDKLTNQTNFKELVKILKEGLFIDC